MRSSKKIFLGLLFTLTVLFLGYCFFPLISYKSDPNPPGRIFLTDRSGKVITDKMYPVGYRKVIKISPESEFVQALLQIEDKSYYTHHGVNILSKLRALRDNIGGKNLSGGSTITEQYVKYIYFKTAKRGYIQKMREAVIALYVDARKDKDTILRSYLDTAYFGNQLYGIGSAIEVYFDKESIEDLTHEEIVILLSLVNNPGIKKLDEEYFTQYFEQTQKRLGYEFEKTYKGKLPSKRNIDVFPFVTQRWLEGEMTRLNINNTQLRYEEQPSYQAKQIVSFVRTSIDAELQNYARSTLQQTLSELAGKNVTNGAIFAIIPSTQEILIYQGSKDFYARDIDGQVDVIQSLRQPGSTVKPFLYLLALMSGAHSDDMLVDLTSEYESFKEGSVYISENYTLREYGLVRLKKALGNSLNNTTVRLARELGLQRVYDFYKSYGFDFQHGAEHYGYSLVLGNASMSLENLVRNYGKLLDLEDPYNFLLYDILSDADNRDISFGVNSVLSTSIPQAVKTGTSSDFRDNWVISYHPDLVVGVWVGNNNNSSMKGVTGITGAGYIWHQVIEKSIELGYITNKKTPLPEEVILSSYCLDIKCFRKENIYTLGEKEYFSRISERIYDLRDIFEEVSQEEQARLLQLGFKI